MSTSTSELASVSGSTTGRRGVFPVAAVAVFVGFALLDGVLQARRQHRRTTDSGIRRPATPEAWAARLTFAGGLLGAGIAGPLVDRAGHPPLTVLDRTWLRGSGLAMAVLSVVATTAAQHSMGTAWRTTVAPDEHTELVTTGAFRWTRNPIYTAVITMAGGLALAVPNPPALAGATAVALGAQWQVRRIEEPYLRRTHPDAYQRYTVRVGRFLPLIGRRSPSPATRPAPEDQFTSSAATSGS